MAGSWGHVLDDDGEGVYQDASLLENGGDVEEFAQQAYGMVWYLASTLGLRSTETALEWVKDAERNWKTGWNASPTALHERKD